MNETKQFVTIREFARQIGLSEPYLRELVETKKLPGIRVGRARGRFLVNTAQAVIALDQLSRNDCSKR